MFIKYFSKNIFKMSELKRLKYSLFLPLLLLLTMWILKIYEYTLDLSFAYLGIFPLKAEGLFGILFSPLIHGDFEHLISNSISFLVLSVGLFYFFRKFAYKLFFLMYFITGILVWLTARESYHIGASGVIYALASFIFFSGVFTKRKELLAIALIVVFQYGSMVWGLFPLKEGVSWESHLMGFITGIFIAVIFNKQIAAEYQVKPETEEKESEDLYDFNNFSATEDIDFEYEFKEDE
jgi:membrane associated rhomboid family serine protease